MWLPDGGITQKNQCWYYMGQDFFVSITDKKLGILDSSYTVRDTGIDFSKSNSTCIANNDVIYDIMYNSPTAFVYDRDNNTLQQKELIIDNNGNNARNPYGITKDGNYIIANDNGCPVQFPSSQPLTLFKKVGDFHYRNITVDEVDDDLRPFLLNNCCINFNPTTGVLCCCTNYGNLDWGIFIYKDGRFNKLVIDLGDVNYSNFQNIWLSNDLLTLMVQENTSSNRGNVVIYRLLSNEGYDALPYRYDLLTESMFTGIADEDAQPLQKFKARCFTYKGKI